MKLENTYSINLVGAISISNALKKEKNCYLPTPDKKGDISFAQKKAILKPSNSK